MNVFTLSLWENFQWGLIYFDQFTNLFMKTFVEMFLEMSNKMFLLEKIRDI